MATYSRQERTTRYIEYTVPCNGPWGAPWAEVSKALSAAVAEYRQIEGIQAESMVGDDALRFFPGDDEIVIRFEVQEQADG